MEKVNMKNERLLWILLLVTSLSFIMPFRGWGGNGNSFINTLNGLRDSVPTSYVPPLISNGALSMHFDYQGLQRQESYHGREISILWEGRRTGSTNDKLFSFGKIDQELSYNNKVYDFPQEWSQTLNEKEAVIICENDYDNIFSIKTEIFVPLNHNMIAIRKTITTNKSLNKPIILRFKYDLNPSLVKTPMRMSFNPEETQNSSFVDINYTAIGLCNYLGKISLQSNKSVPVKQGNNIYAIETSLYPTKNKPEVIEYYLCFSDNMESEDYNKDIKDMRALIKAQSFDGLLSEHKLQWDNFWHQSRLDIPDKQIEKAYIGGLYQLRTNATKWSFPVGIGPWEGRYFGFDEAYCSLGLASSNHLDISKRVAEFRKSVLPVATKRTRFYSRPESFGARFVWETLEDGSEGSPQGFWMDHVFHMSHVAVSCWTQFLYSNNLNYLEQTGYPVMKECAMFFYKQMTYEVSDGKIIIGKCTDIERLGPAVLNPFFTSCGAIYALESAAEAAKKLNVDNDLASKWLFTAKKLRESLPTDEKGGEYVPFEGSKDNTIAMLAGLFPYPVIDINDPKQRKAVENFYEQRYTAGNMYPIGTAICSWYGSWMASAFAKYRDKDKPVALLSEVAKQVGCFADHFEINEKHVILHPWFTTAAGNFVFAVNQIMIGCQGDTIHIAPSVPASWKNYSFTLPAYGGVLVTLKVKNKTIENLTVSPNSIDNKQIDKTLLIPVYMIKKGINKESIKGLKEINGFYQIKIHVDRECLKIV